MENETNSETAQRLPEKQFSLHNFYFFYRHAVTPLAHIPHFRRVSESVPAIFSVPGGIGQAIEKFPETVIVERINRICSGLRGIASLLE